MNKSKEHRNKVQRLWRSKNKDRLKYYNEKYKSKRRIYDMKRWYGITPEDYDALLRKQKGLCAICLKPAQAERKLVVDHDHTTKKVRGLLHDLCNQMIGLAKEDTEKLKAAITYLDKHKAHLA